MNRPLTKIETYSKTMVVNDWNLESPLRRHLNYEGTGMWEKKGGGGAVYVRPRAEVRTKNQSESESSAFFFFFFFFFFFLSL